MKSKENSKVYVALSGGVDSSVAAALLKEQGFDVTGVFIKVWQPSFFECNWEKDRTDAMRVCAELDIPFMLFDLSLEYKRDVVDYMVREYREGKTPNPDVMCNQRIKFGSFFKKARDAGADYIATGHHAQLRRKFLNESKDSNPKSQTAVQLLKGRDHNKDQSYFLWALRQDQLKYVLFPIGEYTKPHVRALARGFNLPTAEKKDSQGLCFLGKLDMKEFLSHFIKPKQGIVLSESNEIIGHHDGAFFYTLGQRHGFIITKTSPHEQPYFVIDKDIEQNSITVSHEPAKADTVYNKKKVELSGVNWIIGVSPSLHKEYSAQLRYRQAVQSCRLSYASDTQATVVFNEPQSVVSKGQSLVLYDGNVCLGGGVIL